ncbi:phosphopantetheine-binding protein [Microbispora sp. NBC_01389]|uniref:phosphopantetheine-binding protein n=1 Tax=Microbispora sp. NBC_01389 TaxID=2903584 RepID=UPI00324716C1
MTDVKASIYDLLTSKFGVPAVQLDDNATLESLDLDSLLLVEFSVSVEKTLGVIVEEQELAAERTLAEVIESVRSKLQVVR